MDEKKKGFIGIQNWLGKLILMLVGTVWLVSDVYDNILSNFFLTEREVVPWGTLGDFSVMGVCGGLIVGGVWLNKIIENIPSFKK